MLLFGVSLFIMGHERAETSTIAYTPQDVLQAWQIMGSIMNMLSADAVWIKSISSIHTGKASSKRYAMVPV